MDPGHRRNDGTAADVSTNGHGESPNEVLFATGVTHRRVDPDDWEDCYVVGDVHGCVDELRALLDRLDPSENDLVVFAGDLVRKGPDSATVVNIVRDAPNMVSVRGNNEEKLLRGTADCGLDAADHAYLTSMPISLSWPGVLVVHAGIDTRRPLEAQSIDTYLTMRSIPEENGYARPFWFESYEGPPRVFFGHTVLDEPLVTDHAVGLDTGCVYGGSLTAYDCRRDEVVSVPAEREYQPRADAKIVEPE